MTKFLLTLLLAFIPLTSYAQHNPETQSDRHWQLTEEQTIATLANSQDDVSLQTLKNTIVLGVMYRDKMDFQRLVDPVIGLHKRTEQQELKDLALAALHVIGTDRAQAYVKKHSAEDPDRSRLLAMEVLDDYLARGSLAAR